MALPVFEDPSGDRTYVDWRARYRLEQEQHQRALPTIWGPRFSTEPDAVARCLALLTPYFHLLPEVRLRHHSQKTMRVDLVAYPRADALPFPAEDVFGIEIKNSFFNDQSKFRRALTQAISYRQAIIDDRRSKRFAGRQLRYVFLFPGPYGVAPGYRWGEAGCPASVQRDIGEIRGAALLAGRFNVGLLVDRQFLLAPERPWSLHPFEFQLSGSPIWDPVAGSRGCALSRRPDDQVGSA